jgi:hypothetical protein
MLRTFQTALSISLMSVFVAVSGQPAPADSSGNDNAYAAFMTALSALTASSNAVLQGERSAGRLAKVRQLVTEKVAAGLMSTPTPTPTPAGATPRPDSGPPGKFVTLAGALDETYMLCNFRWDTVTIVAPKDLSARDAEAAVVIDQLATVAAENYLNAVLTQLKGITPPKATDIPSALKQIFTSYQIKAPIAGLQPAKVKNSRAIVKKSCEADLSEFDAAYYGQKIQFSAVPAAVPAAAAAATGLPSLSFLGPWGAAFDTITGILAPALIDLSNLVASAEQRQEIQAYLSKPEVEGGLTDQGIGLGRTESYSLFAQRLSLAGQFVEQIAVVNAVKVDLSTVDACKATASDFATRSKSGAPSVSFMLCYRAVWADFQGPVADALKTATAYDQLADTGDTNTAFVAYGTLMENHYNSIVTSSTNNPAEFWASVNQLITFAGAVAGATSGTNLDNLKKAIDSLK